MTYWDLASFIALSLTGMFIMSFGSLGVWLLSTLMSVSRKMVLLPICFGGFVLSAAIYFFWSAA
jgi:hypothetical protein